MAIKLMRLGILAFSPIAYNEPWEKYHIPGDWAFWINWDKNFIDHCDMVIVLQIDGWDRSVGVLAEIEYAKQNNKKVFYVVPKNESVLIEELKKAKLI